MNTIENGWDRSHEDYYLSPTRQLTDIEKGLVWKKPLSHKTSDEELRICKEIKRNWKRGEMKIANILLEGDAGSGKTQLAKALSADLGLPYTKVTCFADMDKSDIIGAILPVISSGRLEKMEPDEQIVLKTLYESDGFQSTKVLDVLADIIILLDQTARANAIKGVDGMRSFFYWTDAVSGGASAKESLYHKVIYKITTDSEEIKLLEEALKSHGLLAVLDEVEIEVKKTKFFR